MVKRLKHALATLWGDDDYDVLENGVVVGRNSRRADRPSEVGISPFQFALAATI
jgi:hypothetical protein